MQFVPVVVAALSTMVIGFLWYSPLLFAKPWMLAAGYDINDKEQMEKMRKGAGPTYLRAFLASLLTAFVLWRFFHWVGISSATAGIQVAIVACIGFNLTTKYTDMLFLRQHYLLFLINSGYQLACYAAIGAILGGWRIA
ncbi:MAG TPA: DUF1761 domain-containing protein [Terriglobales bacterium]|nr:DUF1761 domain-containing protein [Terriglobales bacterium]